METAEAAYDETAVGIDEKVNHKNTKALPPKNKVEKVFNPILDDLTKLLVTNIKNETGCKCGIGKKSIHAYYIICKFGDKKLLFHNITPLVVPHTQGVLTHMKQYIKLWINGEWTLPVNVNDDVCTTLITHVIKESHVNLTKNNISHIANKLKIVINKHPENLKHVLIGLKLYLNEDMFETREDINNRLTNYIKTTNGSVWAILKDQGFIDNKNILTTVNKDVRSYQIIVDLAKLFKVDVVSFLYSLQIVNMLNSINNMYNWNLTHTPASEEAIKSLASLSTRKY